MFIKHKSQPIVNTYNAFSIDRKNDVDIIFKNNGVEETWSFKDKMEREKVFNELTKLLKVREV